MTMHLMLAASLTHSTRRRTPNAAALAWFVIAIGSSACTTDFSKYRFDHQGSDQSATLGSAGRHSSAGAGRGSVNQTDAVADAGEPRQEERFSDAATPPPSARDTGAAGDAGADTKREMNGGLPAPPSDPSPPVVDAATPSGPPTPANTAGSGGSVAANPLAGAGGSAGARELAGAGGSAGTAAPLPDAGVIAPSPVCTRIWPSETNATGQDNGVQTCSAFGNASFPATGADSADWFNYGNCGSWKTFKVPMGQSIAIKTHTDYSPCTDCVLTHINYEVKELDDANVWVTYTSLEVNPGLDFRLMRTYVPVRGDVRIEAVADAAFYVSVEVCQ